MSLYLRWGKISTSLVSFLLQEREEDQRTLALTWECLRLLGNTLVALSDLRLNLMSPVPRHLHVVRPFSHYTNPVSLPGAMHHHIPVQVSEWKQLKSLKWNLGNQTDCLRLHQQMNLGATVTVAANSTEGQATPTQPTSQAEQAGQGQTSPTQTSPSNQQAGQGQAGQGQAGHRVIRISHQAVPVVMMQMNTDGVLSPTRHWLNAPFKLCVSVTALELKFHICTAASRDLQNGTFNSGFTSKMVFPVSVTQWLW